ncbi:hypothetical protein [Paenibacillus sp. FSL R7-0652]|uniref:Transposase n=1 Tax=Paenibacillus sp. AN1007 TaxID=3151385 RepID=A0AAU8NGB5_9BACL
MNRQLMERVMTDQGYRDFREFTRLDDLAAANHVDWLPSFFDLTFL